MHAAAGALAVMSLQPGQFRGANVPCMTCRKGYKPLFSLVKEEKVMQGLLPCVLLRHLRLELMQAPRYFTQLNCAVMVLVKKVE